MLPGLTQPQARYLQLMLDLEGRGQVSLRDLHYLVRQCFEAGRTVRPRDRAQVQDVLRRLHEAVKRIQVGHRASRHFQRCRSACWIPEDWVREAGVLLQISALLAVLAAALMSSRHCR